MISYGFSLSRIHVLPMICPYQRHAQELHDIEKGPDGHKCSNSNIPAVSKLELFLARVFSKIIQASPSTG